MPCTNPCTLLLFLSTSFCRMADGLLCRAYGRKVRVVPFDGLGFRSGSAVMFQSHAILAVLAHHAPKWSRQRPTSEDHHQLHIGSQMPDNVQMHRLFARARNLDFGWEPLRTLQFVQHSEQCAVILRAFKKELGDGQAGGLLTRGTCGNRI
jgi:hypothetical protein